MNINLNTDSKTLQQCLKPIYNWGSTTYNNICTNESVTVPWGMMDYVGPVVGFVIGGVIVLAVLAFIVFGVLAIIFDR